VMVLDIASAPPAVGVKLNVTGTNGLFTTRLEIAMPKPTAVTAPPMYPDGALSNGDGSAVVETVTGPPAEAVVPIIMPLNVTTTVVLTPILEPSVSTMLDAPLAPELAVAPPLKVTRDGVTPLAKNPLG